MAKDLDNETVKIKSAQRCQARNGSNYFKLTIQDKEGENHNAMLWECHNEHEIGINNEINISCNYDPSYKNYTINCFALVKKGRLGLTEDEKQELLSGIYNTLGTEQLLTDSNADAVKNLIKSKEQAFINAPAAINHHHNYIGGLLVHTTELIEFINKNCPENVCLEDCILGAITHDFAKVYEYNLEQETGVISYNEQFREDIGLSKDSKIATHLLWGYNFWLYQKAPHLAQMVASHHGCEEWGSLFKPSMPEGDLLFMADYYSSKFGKISVEHLPELPQKTKEISEEKCPECGDILDEGCCHTGCLIGEDEVPF